ncbi:mannonate dehydratase [Clostridium sp. AL.422]|uniref:mannonate dehydratase n=1 Tax=Clostridium TaxID=1485 RepID=UPI00293DD509|nr:MULTISPECIES: mannonate dehydratase [unclassified Clostridium]MDV4149429.1 mannonate dehydratase [Clostridium sp. AL.422]
MKMTFRWYGEDDPVKLEYIKQIPNVTGIVSAIYDIPVGEVWPVDRIEKLKEDINSNGLELEVIESVPVHEDIKLGRNNYKKYIENYKETIRNLSKCGIKTICYNFMPVFDWTRSSIDHLLEDGSSALVYYKNEIDKLDPTKLSLPGWDSSYSVDEVTELIEEYKALGEEGLWENLKNFINEIIPVAIESGINMAIHPDDPPWSIFGIPRIITNEENLDRFLNLYDSVNHGLTLCSGSLGCSRNNDVAHLIRKYGKMKRIHFGHIRNVKILEDGSFEESAHYSTCGSLDIVDIIKAYVEIGFEGHVRPDHGRMIWGEEGRAGYGLYDRGLGAMYIGGIYDAFKERK